MTDHSGEYQQDEQVYPGIWQCGYCLSFTDEAHYVEDRMTGQMRHCPSAEGRERLRGRCGWSSTYGGYHHPPVRCALRHDHSGSHDPQLHGFGKFSQRHGGAVPPYEGLCAACDTWVSVDSDGSIEPHPDYSRGSDV